MKLILTDMHPLVEKLVMSGLSPKEARVYYSALLLGPTTVLQLSKKSELKRATVYGVIDDLVTKGLMNIHELGLKKVFIAEDPTYLKRVIEEKMHSVSEVIPGLVELYKKSGKERIIKTYEGKRALENISIRLMDEARHGDYRYFIGGDVGWRDIDPKAQDTYFLWRERIQLDVKLLFQESARATLHQGYAKLLRQEVKVLPHAMKLNTDIIITPRLLVLSKLSAPESAIVIEDTDIINSYKELFLFMWQSV